MWLYVIIVNTFMLTLRIASMKRNDRIVNWEGREIISFNLKAHAHTKPILQSHNLCLLHFTWVDLLKGIIHWFGSIEANIYIRLSSTNIWSHFSNKQKQAVYILLWILCMFKNILITAIKNLRVFRKLFSSLTFIVWQFGWNFFPDG